MVIVYSLLHFLVYRTLCVHLSVDISELKYLLDVCRISGFRRDVREVFVPLARYTATKVSSVPTLKRGPIGSNIPQERRPVPRRTSLPLYKRRTGCET